jgi:hypothetical protein
MLPRSAVILFTPQYTVGTANTLSVATFQDLLGLGTQWHWLQLLSALCKNDYTRFCGIHNLGPARAVDVLRPMVMSHVDRRVTPASVLRTVNAVVKKLREQTTAAGKRRYHITDEAVKIDRG